MKTRLFLIVACLSCVIGCHAKGGEDGASVSFVHADVRNLFSGEDHCVPDSLIFSKSRVIFLETTEGALLGDISKVFVFEDRIAVYDDRSWKICVFDTVGRFLFSIDRKGRGPGESGIVVSITTGGNSSFIRMCLPNLCGSIITANLSARY